MRKIPLNLVECACCCRRGVSTCLYHSHWHSRPSTYCVPAAPPPHLPMLGPTRTRRRRCVWPSLDDLMMWTVMVALLLHAVVLSSDYYSCCCCSSLPPPPCVHRCWPQETRCYYWPHRDCCCCWWDSVRRRCHCSTHSSGAPFRIAATSEFACDECRTCGPWPSDYLCSRCRSDKIRAPEF